MTQLCCDFGQRAACLRSRVSAQWRRAAAFASDLSGNRSHCGGGAPIQQVAIRTPSRLPVLRRRAQRGHQRKGKGGRAGGNGEGTEDDCTADDCAAASGGLRGGTGRDGGGDDIFCLMSCSAACSVAMFWAICSCLAASCSKLRRTTVRSRVIGSSCCTNSTAEAGAGLWVTGADWGSAASCAETGPSGGGFVVETGNSQPSEGAQVLTICFASSPCDCHASVAPTPIKTAMKKRARARNIRLPINGLSLAR